MSTSNCVEDAVRVLRESALPFDGLESKYLQQKYYQQAFDLVVCIS